jgi:UDP-glucuronate 4-epimerase
MKILVTGAAGFIGAATTLRLLNQGDIVVGIDNHNNYYDQSLKEARLNGFIEHPNYLHERIDIGDTNTLFGLFESHSFDKVIHLAAQAGVRYSIENPATYLQANIIGFGNVLEACHRYSIKHLVYASSSSIYGGNKKIPFSILDSADQPLSIYAATKKTNELMAHAYSHLYNLPTTGLRFFTVYGPWCRPDMALYKFAQAIVRNKPIQIYNNGLHKRDFTYIDDIVDGVIRSLDTLPRTILNGCLPNSNANSPSSFVPWKIYNLGNGKAIDLMTYIAELEIAMGMVAKKEFLPAQPGDIENTFADIKDTIFHLGYSPKTALGDGIRSFSKWFLSYEKNY